MTDSTQLDPTKESLKLPAFESVAMMAVTKALELWRDEALQGAPCHACRQTDNCGQLCCCSFGVPCPVCMSLGSTQTTSLADQLAHLLCSTVQHGISLEWLLTAPMLLQWLAPL